MPKINASIKEAFKNWLKDALREINNAREGRTDLEETLICIWKSIRGWEIVANQSNDLLGRAQIRLAKKSIHGIIKSKLNIDPEYKREWRQN